MIKIIKLITIILLLGSTAEGSDFNYRNTSEYNSSDYLFKNRGELDDTVFDRYQTIDFGIDLAIGSDCGRVDFKSTLKGTLKNLLDAKYFESMGQNILAASPMLLTCYFSPTWCSILKHTRMSANFLSNMRLDQCALIDKYVDTRTEDFKMERQSCVRKAIQRTGGNMEAAMSQCKSGSDYSFDIANWSGASNGAKARTNKLIASSAKWAGFTGREARRSVDLIKALVGDTVIGRGKVTVEYGPSKKALTPRIRLAAIEKDTYSKLCKGLLNKIDKNNNRLSIDRLIKDDELKDIGQDNDGAFIDRQTLRYLSYLPFIQRHSYCRKLASSMALTQFSGEMNRSLDILTVLSQNPNLPANRKNEINSKRQALKESIETTLELKKIKNEPLNKVLSQITSEGRLYQGQATDRTLNSNAAARDARRTRAMFMDCSDGFMCETEGGQ